MRTKQGSTVVTNWPCQRRRSSSQITANEEEV